MANFRNLKFEPGAMSIVQMGVELIGHPSTAINELVKNAYDADAGKCIVYTHFDQNIQNTFLIIKDDGLGMNEKILFGNWLKPSVSSKRDDDKTKRRSEVYNRLFLGSKGIGRLAAMALGKYLTVITKQAQESDYNWLKIDREIFKVEDLLDNITFPGGTIADFKLIFSEKDILEISNLPRNEELINFLNCNYFENFKEGTLLVIEILDDSLLTIIQNEFDSKDIEDTSFYKSLRDLITPLKLNTQLQKELIEKKIIDKELRIDNGESTFDLYYGINLLNSSNRIEEKITIVEPSTILEEYDYRVFGKANNDASIVGRYICKRIEIDLRDEEINLHPSFVLSDEDLNIRRTPELIIEDKYKDPNVGEFYFDIRIYDLDSDAKDKIAKVLKADGRREATKIFSKFLGLKISKNGFGVKPYGEEDKDWLGLGAKRVQKHIETIGPNQIIGNIFLYSPQNDSLNEKTNREGFFENRAFIIFKKIIDGILEETGRKRAKFRESHNLGRNIKSKFNRPDTAKFIQYLLTATNHDEIIKKSQQFVEETNTALDNMEYSLSFSQRLASLGTGLELIYHELAQPTSAIGASIKGIELNTQKISDSIIKQRILERASTITSSLNALETLKESLQPAIGKSIAKIFKPIETFNKVCFLFKENFENKEIIIEISSTLKNLEIKDFEYIFWISFLNIINNAVYWLSFAERKRIIIFEYDESEKVLSISNTGPMIPEEDIDLIFEYGITGKKEKNATGLGLAFTRNMLSMKDWKIWAENKEYGPSFLIQKT